VRPYLSDDLSLAHITAHVNTRDGHAYQNSC
jgi:hypothetical protein